MRIWFDAEFIDDSRTIELLSIGLVREDGAEFYAEAAEADRSRAGEWLSANVLPHLKGPVLPRAEIAHRIVSFAGAAPEFWADHAAYDWVALCQLYGRMIDIPAGWPWYCRDVRWLRDQIEDAVIALPQHTGRLHHALDDAKHCRAIWEFLSRPQR